MLASLLSLPVSVALLIWIARMKKDNPFPKFTFVKLLIAGAIAGALSSVVTIGGSVISVIFELGLDQVRLLLTPEGAKQFAEMISQLPAPTLSFSRILRSFLKSFLLVGFVEEIFKFLCTKAVIKKKGVAPTWMDALLSLCVVAVSFQLIEDIGYSEGSVMTAIFRALTPFHFTFAAIMGYYYGSAKVNGKKFHYFLAIFLPSFVHTLYDFSINMLRHEDMFIILVLFMNLFLFVLTIVMIVRIRKWHLNKTLDIPIE